MQIVNDLQNWTLAPSPPEPVGTKSELVEAWQLAVLFGRWSASSAFFQNIAYLRIATPPSHSPDSKRHSQNE